MQRFYALNTSYVYLVFMRLMQYSETDIAIDRVVTFVQPPCNQRDPWAPFWNSSAISETN